MPKLTLPSPAVSALSANDGPKVGAVRTRRPVAGSSLNTKPPADDPVGALATSIAVERPMASPSCGAAMLFVRSRTTLRNDGSTPVCAEADADHITNDSTVDANREYLMAILSTL